MRYLSEEQIKETFRKAGASNANHYSLLYLLLHSGLRVSEAINVRPMNLIGNQIEVRGKGNKTRNVNIPDKLKNTLQIHIDREKIGYADKLYKFGRIQAFRLCKQYSGMSPHAFRHTYAINLLRETHNIRYVQLQLGHSQLSVTEKYLQFNEYDEENAKLTDLFDFIDD